MLASEKARIEAAHQFEMGRVEPPPGFPRLPDIPGGRYVDPEFQKLERERMWLRSWVYAIHSDEVPEVGSYIRWSRLGEPVFFIRGEDNRIRCFYNTCRHRGAPVVTEERGKSKSLTCKYHGWTYNWRGDLTALRDKRDFVGLDLSCRSLIEVRCESIGNFVFVNFDNDAESLDNHLGPVAVALKEMRPETLRLVDKVAIDVPCNVKILLDAFLEVYHLKSIHQNTVDRFLDHRGTAITLWERGHSRMVTPFKRKGWQDPGTVGLPFIEGADPWIGETNPSVMAYPNLVSPLNTQGFPILCFWPKTDTTMTIETHWFGPSWGDGPRPEVWDIRLRNFLRILDEDLQFAGEIQSGVMSSGLRGFPLNYQERRIYHWHEELDRRIGQDSIPAELRVPYVLGDFVETAPLPAHLVDADS